MRYDPASDPGSIENVLRSGYQGFPDCEECQCYPEGRNDCPKHRECIERLGPGGTHGWPRGYEKPLHAMDAEDAPPSCDVSSEDLDIIDRKSLSVAAAAICFVVCLAMLVVGSIVLWIMEHL